MPTGQRRVDPKLLEVLVCPLSKKPLRYDAERQELISDASGLAYPIRDGIPIMLVDEARPLDEPADTSGGESTERTAEG
ncbi:MAG: Trm112 family protein [Defluviicoccus sp.]|nr:MAG: Trm112 family protein [Defluviicoccus sp.]